MLSDIRDDQVLRAEACEKLPSAVRLGPEKATDAAWNFKKRSLPANWASQRCLDVDSCVILRLKPEGDSSLHVHDQITGPLIGLVLYFCYNSVSLDL